MTIHQDHLYIGFSNQRANEYPRASQIEVSRGSALVPACLVRIEIADIDVSTGLMAPVWTQPATALGTIARAPAFDR